MKINFLQASVPLTKTFTLEDGEIRKVGHPRVIEYVSHEESWASIEDLHGLLIKHADKGHCLLKGNLSRPLLNESRAGTTDANAMTHFIVLDLDGLKGVENVESFLRLVGLDGVDYIVQFSSSSGVIPSRGISAHILIRLDRGYPPALLKQWLMHLNSTVPILRKELGLTRTGNALRWVLDVTTCQNDKLIYIAPPVLGEGVVDKFVGERIALVKKQNRTFTLPTNLPSPEAIKVAANAALAQLREQSGLPKRTAVTFKREGPVEFMSKPDQAIVTGVKHDRGFVYLNLNGGDSWGYYHSENNPKFIHNFKGEPVFKTSELLPDYWGEVRDAVNDVRVDSSGTVFLAFRDFRTSTYWNGTWTPDENALTLAPAKTKDQLKDFLIQHRQPVGDYIPDWQIHFDPQTATIVDLEARTVNTFEPTEFMGLKPVAKYSIPPIMHKTILHALGGDEECLEHFLNGLACIFRYREKNGTAWVMHGNQGTGKGALLNKILRPLFGSTVVYSRTRDLDSTFNGQMEKALILWVDEAEVALQRGASLITADLKGYITEPSISIRRMHMMQYEARSYMNVILASNKGEIITIDPSDRRFNVAPFQPNKLELTTEEYEEGLASELPRFAEYLTSRPADKEIARTALNNQAKQKMINIGMSSTEVVSKALLEGDFKFLWEQRLTGQIPAGNASRSMLSEQYSKLLREIAEGKKPYLTREEVMIVYQHSVGMKDESVYKFVSTVKHKGIEFEATKVDGKSMRVFKVDWKMDEELKKEILG